MRYLGDIKIFVFGISSTRCFVNSLNVAAQGTGESSSVKCLGERQVGSGGEGGCRPSALWLQMFFSCWYEGAHCLTFLCRKFVTYRKSMAHRGQCREVFHRRAIGVLATTDWDLPSMAGPGPEGERSTSRRLASLLRNRLSIAVRGPPSGFALAATVLQKFEFF